MKRGRQILFIVGIIFIAWAGVKPVQAHALLLRSIPPANAMLDSAPAKLELFFTEDISPRLIKINLKGSDGRNMRLSDTALAAGDATHLIGTLPALPDGAYLIIWQVRSASDGHQSDGTFPFVVGKVDPAVLGNTSSLATEPAPTPAATMLVDGILYLSIAAIIGSLFFSSVVWEPARKGLELPQNIVAASEKSAWLFAMAAVIVFGGANILNLLVQTGQARGVVLGWPWQPEFADLLFGTRGGMLAIFRFGIVFVIEELVREKRNHNDRSMTLMLCLGVILTFSLESHAMADAQPYLAVFIDWLHFAAVSIWVGGLFAFILSMRHAAQVEVVLRTQLSARMIARFTTVAMASVGILTISGGYASIVRVGSLPALFETDYGHALIVKLVFVAIMLALGATNLLYISPNMQKAAHKLNGNISLMRHFNYLLGGEVLLGVCALLWVGIFTGLPSASSAYRAAGFQKTGQADDLQVSLRIDPGQPGLNTFLVTIRSAGKPVSDAKDVSLEFSSLTGRVPASKAPMVNMGNGSYRLQGSNLAIADQWDIKVVVIRDGKFDAYADFKLAWK
jgi:copper transport protein